MDAEQNGLFDSAVLTQLLQYRLGKWEDGTMVKVQPVPLAVPAVDPKARGFVIQKILLSDTTAESWHVSHEQLVTLHLAGVTCSKGEGKMYLLEMHLWKWSNNNSSLFWNVKTSQWYFQSFGIHGNQCLAWSLAHNVDDVVDYHMSSNMLQQQKKNE